MGSIDFSYDAKRDIVFATPHWRIETLNDVAAWYQQYVDYFEHEFHGKKVDLILVLGDFEIESSIAVRWGEYRAKMNNTYNRYSCRVGGRPRVALFSKTSGVRHDASTSEALTVEDAIEVIMAARRNGGV
jgi:hypothetical protein